MQTTQPSWASDERARKVMRGNKSRNTLPELAVRSALHRRGLRYRVAARPVAALPRSADLVFPRARVAVFVDGCFWHGCPTHYVPSKSNVAYWDSKIARNKERDAETDARLAEAGWLSLRIWAHEDPGYAAEVIAWTIKKRMRAKP
jgi:DNA mismatch endonuclease, patch repair protein